VLVRSDQRRLIEPPTGLHHILHGIPLPLGGPFATESVPQHGRLSRDPGELEQAANFSRIIVRADTRRIQCASVPGVLGPWLVRVLHQFEPKASRRESVQGFGIAMINSCFQAHDSWVSGEEPYVSLHFVGAGQYAK
jgi:hypothetical protein